MMSNHSELSCTAPAGRLMHDTVRMAVLAACLGLAVGLAPLALGQAHAADTAHLTITASSFGATRDISIGLNKSLILDLPVDAREVIVSQPGVANAILRSKRRAVLQSTGSGNTNIIFLDANGRTIVVLDVSVKGAVSNVAAALRDAYAKVLPGSNIAVESVGLVDAQGNTINRVVLSGTVNSAEDADKALKIAGQFAGSDQNVASVITVAGPQQVMLKVTVAEVQRNLAKQLGINLSGSFSVGSISGGFNTPMATNAQIAAVGGNTTIPIGSSSIDVELRALETRGGLRTLAEPVLTALSGQPASFLAGGELPYETIDADGRRVVDFKPYGVQLEFTPTIKSNGAIQLEVKSTVSEPAGQGALNTRDVSTTVELGVGQTLSIGGMLSERSRQDIRRLPGLGDIPILGALFRSREYTSDRTELIFLVTPYYARAKTEMPILPTDDIHFAGDAEAIFLGHIETIYGVGPDGMRGSYDGSVGFLLD
jgi:pilus assembly protein CpaC